MKHPVPAQAPSSHRTQRVGWRRLASSLSLCSLPRMAATMRLCAAALAVGGVVAAPAAAQGMEPSGTVGTEAGTDRAQPAIDPSQVPSYMDTVKRGLRTRIDLGGRYNSVGLPSPPVRLELDERVGERDDFDVQGTVLFGYDRAFGVPLKADLFGDFNVDLNPDSPISPFIDDQSQFPRVRLYSAFIGLSGSPGDGGLQPFSVNIGRMTELVESPITYDGASMGVRMQLPGLGHIGAKLWGGLDAPQRLADDPFTRTSRRAYGESYALDDRFFSSPGSVYVLRTPIVDPILNPVGGLNVDGRFAGFGFVLNHNFMPAQSLWFDDPVNNANDLLLPLQRSKLGVSYRFDSDALLANVALDTRATDFVPRNVNLRGDVMTGDGATRVGLVSRVQFLEDITTYDGTFRAFNPELVFNQGLADQQEQLRARDQIRHLNFGPPQQHFYAMLDAEQQLPAGFSVQARGRVRQHFDDNVLDAFRTNLYEAGAGASWSPGFAFDVGTEVVGGLVNSGEKNNFAYALVGEGVVSFIENRLWIRSVLLEGKLSNLSEVFVRRNDIQSRQVLALGQWSGALSSTTRYDILDAWSVMLRVDGDALSPIDSLSASYYLGALVATSVRF